MAFSSSRSRRAAAVLAMTFSAAALSGVLAAPASAADPITLTAKAHDHADGDRHLPTSGGTVTNTVTFTGLTAGVEYQIRGELMDKASGTSTGATASGTFTATKSHGSVRLTVTVPASLAGRTLVVYDTITSGGRVVATFKDLNCSHQTITVGKVRTHGQPAASPSPSTSTAPGGNTDDTSQGNASLPVTGASIGSVVGVGIVGVGLGAMLLLSTRRRDNTADETS